MIASNKIVGSVGTVALFWYSVLAVVSLITGTAPTSLFVYIYQSVIVAIVGTLLGAGFTLGLGSALGASQESTLLKGSRNNGASVTLGDMPRPVSMERRRLPAGLLESLPWWAHVSDKAPSYAAAIRAVLEVMNAEPRLPASPHPGGHAGRTLIEHSIAVVPFMLDHAASWIYEGQRDKRGHVRVRLQQDEPHTFVREDAPLLILTALAHDIGKITCYTPRPNAEQKAGSRTLLVDETRPNHDHEGARILRRIPEIMALPIVDRTALITAVGYYHHPFGLPSSAAWLTDRMRSLTELLAVADIATGSAEGHTLTSDQATEDGDDELVDDEVTHELSAADLGVDDSFVAELQSLQQLAEAPARGKKKKDPKPEEAQYRLDPEIALFMESVRKRGAVNGDVVGMRFAFKKGAYVYVDESKMRRILRNQVAGSSATLSESMADDPNGSAYTRRLLEQLDALDAVLKTHEGVAYQPGRALFRITVDGMKGAQSSYSYVMFVLDATIIPGVDSLPDWQGAINISKPLWGGGKRPTQAVNVQAGASIEPDSRVEHAPVDAAAAVAIAPDDEIGDEDLPPSMLQAIQRTELSSDGLSAECAVDPEEDDEMPPSIPVLPSEDAQPSADPEQLGGGIAAYDEQPSSELPAQNPTHATSPVSSAAVPDPMHLVEDLGSASIAKPVHAGSVDVHLDAPAEGTVDAHSILSEIIASAEFQQRYQALIVTRGDARFATYPIDSPAGLRLKQALDRMESDLAGSGAALDRSGIRVAKVRENQATSYIIKIA